MGVSPGGNHAAAMASRISVHRSRSIYLFISDRMPAYSAGAACSRASAARACLPAWKAR